MRRLLMIGAVAAGAAAAGFYYKVRPWWKSWGVDPAEAELPMAGDDLVREPNVTDTRGITIDAPPSAIWPWLVQMGYGRGGWYSYDRMDMKGRSADTIMSDWQHLEAGDTIPTFPGGGFEVKLVEPETALVLFLDDEIVEGWRRSESGGLETPTAGLAFAGAMSERSMPGPFAISWAFALVRAPDGRTRLIERFRGAIETDTPSSRIGAPFMGFGIFVMMQRQMVGIRDRAEKLARERGVPGFGQALDTEPETTSAPEEVAVPQETPA